MTKEELNSIKEDPNIKFIYRIPCSFYKERVEYIVIGYSFTIDRENIRNFTIDSWFQRIQSGSLLPYVCSTLSRSNKVKEFVNIYEKPNVLALRNFVNNIKDSKELIQECLWGEQYIKEGKVNRIDVFKDRYLDSTYALDLFYDAVNPIYEMNLKSN